VDLFFIFRKLIILFILKNFFLKGKDTTSLQSDSSVFEEIPKPTGITFIGLNENSTHNNNGNNNGSANVWFGTSDGLVYIFNVLNTSTNVITEDDSDFGSTTPNLIIKSTNLKHTLKGPIIFIGFIDANDNFLPINTTSGQQYAADDSKIMNKVHKSMFSLVCLTQFS
jgi:hypothetical protein